MSGPRGRGRTIDPRLLRALPVTAVLIVVGIATVLIATAHWRKGTAVLGVASVLAIVLRLTIPDSRIGPLAVRTRSFDVGFLGVLTIALGLLSVGFYWF